ncbi:A24 family peptidase [Methylotenera sp.]|uniref:A24 family peptidase n=1 Tax=Methylotenera sp. TaxID=2051956 RepID=UPI002ED8EE63
MTPKLMGLLALVPMLVLMLLAAKQDISSHRISNKLVLTGVLFGVILNGILPEGWGFNSQIPGALGWLAAFKGLVIGMALFLPLYWLRAMGAGDVKLMGMVGAFLGPNDVLGAVLATLLAGGVLALFVVMWSKQLRPMLQNVKLIFYGSAVKLSTGQAPLVDDLPVSVGKLPYAVAIGLGTFAYLIWQRLYL